MESEFHSMKRKELQALCKKHGIAANLTNREMADRLYLKGIENPNIPEPSSSSNLHLVVELGSETDSIEPRKTEKARFCPGDGTFIVMDSEFHSMKRKELQALCKKHGIPANLTNLEMAKRLYLKGIENPNPPEPSPSSNLVMEVGDPTDSTAGVPRKKKKVRFSPENETFIFIGSESKDSTARKKPVTRRTFRKNLKPISSEVESSVSKTQVGRRSPRLKSLSSVDAKGSDVISITSDSESSAEKKQEGKRRVGKKSSFNKPIKVSNGPATRKRKSVNGQRESVEEPVSNDQMDEKDQVNMRGSPMATTTPETNGPENEDRVENAEEEENSENEREKQPKLEEVPVTVAESLQDGVISPFSGEEKHKDSERHVDHVPQETLGLGECIEEFSAKENKRLDMTALEVNVSEIEKKIAATGSLQIEGVSISGESISLETTLEGKVFASDDSNLSDNEHEKRPISERESTNLERDSSSEKSQSTFQMEVEESTASRKRNSYCPIDEEENASVIFSLQSPRNVLDDRSPSCKLAVLKDNHESEDSECAYNVMDKSTHEDFHIPLALDELHGGEEIQPSDTSKNHNDVILDEENWVSTAARKARLSIVTDGVGCILFPPEGSKSDNTCNTQLLESKEGRDGQVEATHAYTSLSQVEATLEENAEGETFAGDNLPDPSIPSFLFDECAPEANTVKENPAAELDVEDSRDPSNPSLLFDECAPEANTVKENPLAGFDVEDSTDMEKDPNGTSSDQESNGELSTQRTGVLNHISDGVGCVMLTTEKSKSISNNRCYSNILESIYCDQGDETDGRMCNEATGDFPSSQNHSLCEDVVGNDFPRELVLEQFDGVVREGSPENLSHLYHAIHEDLKMTALPLQSFNDESSQETVPSVALQKEAATQSYERTQPLESEEFEIESTLRLGLKYNGQWPVDSGSKEIMQLRMFSTFDWTTWGASKMRKSEINIDIDTLIGSLDDQQEEAVAMFEDDPNGSIGDGVELVKKCAVDMSPLQIPTSPALFNNGCEFGDTDSRGENSTVHLEELFKASSVKTDTHAEVDADGVRDGVELVKKSSIDMPPLQLPSSLPGDSDTHSRGENSSLHCSIQNAVEELFQASRAKIYTHTEVDADGNRDKDGNQEFSPDSGNADNTMGDETSHILPDSGELDSGRSDRKADTIEDVSFQIYLVNEAVSMINDSFINGEQSNELNFEKHDSVELKQASELFPNVSLAIHDELEEKVLSPDSTYKSHGTDSKVITSSDKESDCLWQREETAVILESRGQDSVDCSCQDEMMGAIFNEMGSNAVEAYAGEATDVQITSDSMLNDGEGRDEMEIKDPVQRASLGVSEKARSGIEGGTDAEAPEMKNDFAVSSDRSPSNHGAADNMMDKASQSESDTQLTLPELQTREDVEIIHNLPGSRDLDTEISDLIADTIGGISCQSYSVSLAVSTMNDYVLNNEDSSDLISEQHDHVDQKQDSELCPNLGLPCPDDLKEIASPSLYSADESHTTNPEVMTGLVKESGCLFQIHEMIPESEPFGVERGEIAIVQECCGQDSLDCSFQVEMMGGIIDESSSLVSNAAETCSDETTIEKTTHGAELDDDAKMIGNLMEPTNAEVFTELEIRLFSAESTGSERVDENAHVPEVRGDLVVAKDVVENEDPKADDISNLKGSQNEPFLNNKKPLEEEGIESFPENSVETGIFSDGKKRKAEVPEVSMERALRDHEDASVMIECPLTLSHSATKKASSTMGRTNGRSDGIAEMPKKLLNILDMKENNTLSSKEQQLGTFTATKHVAQRKPLKDLQQNL